MPLGQVTGVRSLQDFRYLQDFIAAKAQNMFSAEVAAPPATESMVDVVKALDKVAEKIDEVAAIKQDASWRQEHTDAYCTARDFRYAHRSRRWLFAKALRSDFDHAYALWQSFVQENYVMHKEIIAPMPTRDVNALVKQPFKEIMEL